MYKIILVAFLTAASLCSTNPIQSESYVIISSAAGAVHNTSVTHSYINSFSTTPYVIISIVNLVSQPNVISWGISFQLLYPQTSTQFVNEFTLVSPGTVVTLVKLRYLAVDHVDYPNYMVRYYSGPFSTFPGGLAQGTGYRKESHDLSIVGGLFNLTQPISLISYIVGFQGTFDLATYSLETTVKVVNTTHFRLTFIADDNNIYSNGSAYIVAYINNLTTFADVGHLYGYQQKQLNTLANITTTTTFFIGLSRFTVNDTSLTIILNGNDQNINTGAKYWNLTYSYIYFRLNILCSGDPCPCFDGYQQDSAGVCHEICQDARFYELPCDDGNAVDGDGCSSTCAIEPYYYCYNTGGRSASYCLFVGPFTLSYIDTFKLADANRANITFSVVPAYSNLVDLQWGSLLSAMNSTFQVESASYSDGVVSVIGVYSAVIETQLVTLSLGVPSSGPYQHIITSTTTFYSATNNGFPARLHSSDDYQLGGAFKYLVLATDILYWLTFLLALYCSKFIGVQMMSALQISFMALVSLNHYSATMQNLPYLKYSLGINPLFQELTNYAPIRLSRLGFHAQFISDYNATIVTLIGCALTGLGMYIHHIVQKRKDQDTEDRQNKRMARTSHVLTDCLVIMALFNLYGIVFAFALNIMHQPSLNVPDIAFGAAMVVLLIGMAVFYGTKSRLFKESMRFFQVQRSNVARYHPLFMMLDRFVFSILAAVLGQNSYSTYILIVWVLAYTLFVAIKDPYELKRDYYRSLATQTCILLVLALYCLLRNGSLSDSAYAYIPFGVLLVLLINLALNMSFIIIQFKAKVLEIRQQNEGKRKLREMLKAMKEAQQMQMSLLRSMRQKGQAGSHKRRGKYSSPEEMDH